MDKIEFLVLKNLLNNEEYLRKTIPFIKKEYFQESNQKIVFEEISSFVGEYNETPTKEILTIDFIDLNPYFQGTTRRIGAPF